MQITEDEASEGGIRLAARVHGCSWDEKGEQWSAEGGSSWKSG